MTKSELRIESWYTDIKDGGIRFLVVDALLRPGEFIYAPEEPYKLETPGKLFYWHENVHHMTTIGEFDSLTTAKNAMLDFLKGLNGDPR